jgi:cephalosporin-C deacetylase-like acetyl esterase
MAFFFLLLAAPFLRAQPAVDMEFYHKLEDGKQAAEMMPRFLRARAQVYFDERAKRVAATTEWAAYKQKFRQAFVSALGGFPERTPLHPSVTGVIERDGYRIEKVVFESQPKFFVTANLYVPTTSKGPYPAILFPLGHESGGKSHFAWQIVISNLARRGFVLLAWDPIGQGERVQLWDEDFQASKVGASTTEHTIQGIQSLLVGDALARYTIWDGMRALDYLLSRPEVDKTRVGITGNSGGGTHTSYIGSLDDRIHVAAPSCYLTNWRKLLETIGPQDAEQCLPGWIAKGYDHPDFIYGFAPKPFIMLTGIRDFFSIGGARETYAEAARVYDSLGAADKFAKVEVDDGHGYNKERRDAAYRWFTKWLKGSEDTRPEYEIPLLSETELNCTPTGQVATSLRGQTLHGLIQARWKELRKPGTLEDARRLTGFTARTSVPPIRYYGSHAAADGIRVTKLVYETEPGVIIPAVLFEGQGSGKQPAVIVAHGRGKAASRELAMRRAAAGEVVLAIDLRGLGETASSRAKSSDWTRYFGDYDSAMTAILLNRPLVGMRAEDISAAVSLLAARENVDSSRISVEGIGGGAAPALYATAFDTRIHSATLEEMLASYETVIRHRIHRGVFEQIVPGALRSYDLPDLIHWCAPRPVKVISTVDALGM